MIERREFISICRQIGAMMEVGVDFLRITQALRAQTDNPRLLELLDQLDADLKEGDSLSEAMSHAPDVFSAFAVSLVQQGEARGNIEAAWERIADFYRQQAREDLDIGADDSPLEPVTATSSPSGSSLSGASPASGMALGSPRTALPVAALAEMFERIEAALGRTLVGVAVLLCCLGAARTLVEVGVVPPHLGAALQLGTAAVLLLVGGLGLLAKSSARRKRELRCAFCGRAQSRDLPLTFSPRFEGAGICASCASHIAQSAPLGDAERAQQKGERQKALRSVADALPQNGEADEDILVLDDDDPLASPLR